MIKNVEIHEFLELSETYPVVDVRAPIEFKKGHIPGAVNIPVFNDEERAAVGTAYKQKGRYEAINLALGLAGPKLSQLYQGAKEISADNTVLVHCWRGGMRSDAVSWLLDFGDINTYKLNGGYKSYRRHIRNSFSREAKIVILSGMTGSGKTDILHEMEKLGEQVLDLEGLACHKGSAFGFLGQGEQPSNEQFENDIYEAWIKFDFSKNIWIEDESKKIGKVVINDPLYEQIRKSPVVKIDINRALRVKRLAIEYAKFDRELLMSSVEKIRKRMGGKDTDMVINLVKENDFNSAIDLVLNYYDKSYSFGMSRRLPGSVFSMELKNDLSYENARDIIKFYEEFNENK